MLSVFIVAMLGVPVEVATDDCTGAVTGTLSAAIAAGETVTFALPGDAVEVSGDCSLDVSGVTIDAGLADIVLRFTELTAHTATFEGVTIVVDAATLQNVTLSNATLTTVGAASFVDAATFTQAVVSAQTLTLPSFGTVNGSALTAVEELTLGLDSTATSVEVTAGNIVLVEGTSHEQSALRVHTGYDVIADGPVVLIATPVMVRDATTADEVLAAWSPTSTAPASPTLRSVVRTEGGGAVAHGAFVGTTGVSYTLSFYARSSGALFNAGTLDVTATTTDVIDFTAPVDLPADADLTVTLTNSSDTSGYATPRSSSRAQLAFEAQALTVDESAGSVEVVLVRSSTDGAISLLLSTSDGTASADVDYVAYDATVTFADGEDTVSVEIAILHDDTIEPDETFVVSASSTVFDTSTTGELVVTIVDDDSPVEETPSATTTTQSDGCSAVPRDGWGFITAGGLAWTLARRRGSRSNSRPSP